jgi:hypothetical protein
MKMIMSRSYEPNETRSTLFVVDGEHKYFEGKALELPNKGNQNNISCINEGVYDVEKYNSPTKGLCFLIKNVQGRSNVEMHVGNFATGKKIDTLGCILPGMRFIDIDGNGELDVADSALAMTTLLDIMPDSFKLYIV